MARARVEHVKCDRCKREELQPVPATPKTSPDFECKLFDKALTYNDLCFRCKETLEHAWKELKEWDKVITTTLLTGALLNTDKVPSLNPAPDYSPPKPHSMGAAKK